MKIGRAFAVLALIAMVVGGVEARKRAGTNPYTGQQGNGFAIHVIDTDIDAQGFELVTADTGFTQMAVDSVLWATFQTGTGETATDTAVVHITGLRPLSAGAAQDTLRYWTERLEVPGGDTVATDSTYHAIEAVWVDSAMVGTIQVFSQYNTPSTSTHASIASRRIHRPVAHRLFGRRDTPTIEEVIFSNYASQAITYEFRVYHDVLNDLTYDNDYEVKASAYIPANGDPVSYVFPGGLRLHRECYIAVVAKGAVDNADGAATIIGTVTRR